MSVLLYISIPEKFSENLIWANTIDLVFLSASTQWSSTTTDIRTEKYVDKSKIVKQKTIEWPYDTQEFLSFQLKTDSDLILFYKMNEFETY